MHWIIPIGILIFFELIADILAKEWSIKNYPLTLAVGAMLAYLLANMSWLYALKQGSGLARGAVVFSVASAILATGIGFLLYREHVTTIQFIGIIVGIIAISLIFW
mgnify:FL=1